MPLAFFFFFTLSTNHISSIQYPHAPFRILILILQSDNLAVFWKNTEIRTCTGLMERIEGLHRATTNKSLFSNVFLQSFALTVHILFVFYFFFSLPTADPPLLWQKLVATDTTVFWHSARYNTGEGGGHKPASWLDGATAEKENKPPSAGLLPTKHDWELRAWWLRLWERQVKGREPWLKMNIKIKRQV